MNSPPDLVRAIRSGHLSAVLAALDAGASVELTDGQGDPGLPLGIACFMGHVEIVRELVKRGAPVNRPDNLAPTSPLCLAVRAGKAEVVKALIELGAEVPSGMQTGLTGHEVTLAQWKARHNELAAQTGQPPEDIPVFEEIEMVRCFGTDTGVLDAEMIRMAREMGNRESKK